MRERQEASALVELQGSVASGVGHRPQTDSERYSATPMTPTSQPLQATSAAQTAAAHPPPAPAGATNPRRLARRLVVVDMAMIATAIIVTLLVGWGYGQPLSEDRSRLVLMVALAVAWPLMLWQTQSRARSVLVSGVEEYRRVIVATAGTVMLVATAAYFTDTTRAKGFLVGAVALGLALLLVGRWLTRGALQRALHHGSALHRVFVVCAEAHLRRIEDELGESQGRYQLAGSWTTTTDPGDPADLIAAAEAAGADTILLVPGFDTELEWTQRLGWALEETDLQLLVSPALVAVAGPRLSMHHVQGMPFVAVEPPKFSGPARVAKRALDVFGSALGLLIMALPMAIIALAVRLDSPGPAIFSQPRLGRGGQLFRCHKFRTMREGAHTELETLRAQADTEGATFKLTDDPRVTRVGAFLRRTSLDELPQLWNVLVGQMSLVGPRPHQISDTSRYEADALRRLLVKPGMTGLWQVSGRSDTTWDKNVMLDLYYVENWSFSLDLVILMRTVRAVLTGSGAY